MRNSAAPSVGSQLPIVFTTADLPATQRLEAWNDAFGSLNAISLPEPGGGPVGTRSEYWRLDSGTLLSQSRVSACHFRRDRLRARRDGLDHWVLRVLRRGESIVRQPGFEARLRPGELLLYSLHECWATDWTDAEWVSLCLPRDLHPQLSAGLGSLPGGPQRGAGAGLLADILLALPGRMAGAAPDEVPALAEAVRAAVAACLLAGRPAGQDATAAALPRELAKEKVRQAIRRNIGSVRLSPARLAAAAGLSRTTLYRLFESEGGVARAIRDMRLSLLHTALRDPALAQRSIAELAEAHGFADASSFSRAFRAAYGVTPGEVRARGLPGPAPPRAAGSEVPPPPDADLAAQLYGRRDWRVVVGADAESGSGRMRSSG